MLYSIKKALNIYHSPDLDQLATQAIAGRMLCIQPFTFLLNMSLEEVTSQPAMPIQVTLYEDGCSGWITPGDLALLESIPEPFQSPSLSEREIEQRRNAVVAFAKEAMRRPNVYIPGGTLFPNYDGAGLVQAAFASIEVWLPRQADRQEEFVRSIKFAELEPGDLLFFGTKTTTTHVGLSLGDMAYIHSSSQEMGYNGICIEHLSDKHWKRFPLIRTAGRVVASYPSDLLSSQNR